MIITLCGSLKFEAYFHLWKRALSLAGNLVFEPISYPSSNWSPTPSQKEKLDAVYKEKIRASDAVLFINRYAYMGDSTISEFDFAMGEAEARAHEHQAAIARHRGDPQHPVIVTRQLVVCALESWGKGLGYGPSHVKPAIDHMESLLGVRSTSSPRRTTTPDVLSPHSLMEGEENRHLWLMIREGEKEIEGAGYTE
jgi:hypothetical protein